MVTRLAEECGELAAEGQRWEDVGLKRQKLGPPDPAETAKELLDVLTVALAIARHYDLLGALTDRIELSVARAVESGHLTAEEAAPADG